MEDKKPWQSKTVLFNVLLSLAGMLSALGFVPGVQAWIQGHSDLIITGIGAVGMGLRLVTQGKISID